MSKLPNSVMGWENPADLIQRQTSKINNVMLPQMILMCGALVDVFKKKIRESDKLYGNFAGQKLEQDPDLRTRVLGLPIVKTRKSKEIRQSSDIESHECFALSTSMIATGDVLEVANTQAKWQVGELKTFETEAATIFQFTVYSLFE